jgi:hypothetical protein
MMTAFNSFIFTDQFNTVRRRMVKRDDDRDQMKPDAFAQGQIGIYRLPFTDREAQTFLHAAAVTSDHLLLCEMIRLGA